MKKTIKYLLIIILAPVGLFLIANIIFMAYLFLSGPPSKGEPFTAGISIGGIGITKEGTISIQAGQKFSIGVYIQTHYKLENIDVRFELPKQIVVLSKDIKVLRNMNAESSTHVTDILLKSETDWSKWEHPIKIHIEFDAHQRKGYRWPGGHYSKTITWSHEGEFDSGWK